MRKTLVILCYQREITPFMQNLIHFADGIFERIVYFTPCLANDNSRDCDSIKLSVVQCEKNKWRISLVKSFFKCFSFDVLNQLRVACVFHQNVFRVLRQIFVHEVCSETLVMGVKEYFKTEVFTPDETVVLSTWFATEAYAACKLKNKFPDIKAVSYAHSFEISTKKNPLMAFDMNVIKHKYCDEIIFISKLMRDQYFNVISNIYPYISMDNTRIMYLGSQKRFPNVFSNCNNENVISILSCSSATPIKRVDLIIKALKLWDSSVNIVWTHIGGGPLLDDLKNLADKELKGINNVSFRFLGSLSNVDVQSFYCSNPVDLFVSVSEDEGLPVSIMECMSYGVPVIATDVGGVKEIVNNSTGYLLDSDFTSDELLKKINEYLSLSLEEKTLLRKQVYEYWKNNFDSSHLLTYFSKWLFEL